MFVRQGTGLQGQAVFRTKLSFRPHSTESFTHKKMTLSLADRSQKTTGIKVLSQVGVDPEHDREEKIKVRSPYLLGVGVGAIPYEYVRDTIFISCSEGRRKVTSVDATRKQAKTF